MSYEERVTPGKVNNLISFFEHQGEENKQHGNSTQECGYEPGHDKQNMMDQFFSKTTTTYNNQSQQSQGDTISVEKVQHQENRDGVLDRYQVEEIHQVNGTQTTHNLVEVGAEVSTRCQFELEVEEEHFGRETNDHYTREDSHTIEGDPDVVIEKDNVEIVYHCQTSNEKPQEGVCTTGDYQHEPPQTGPQYSLKMDLLDYEDSLIQAVDPDQERCSEPSYSLSDGIQVVHIAEQQVTNTQETEVLSNIQAENTDVSVVCSEDQNHSENLVGFTSISELNEDQKDTEIFTIPYELLPNHLKGFTTPTVFPAPYLDADADATAMKKAMKGLGTNEAAIIEVLTNRSLEQRLAICAAYERLFQKSLVHELKKELSGKLEDVIVGIVTPFYDLLATELRRAVRGTGTDEDALIEILCIYDDSDIALVKDAYERLFKRTLKDDIYDDTSGDFRKVLLSILAARREDPKASPSSVASQLCQTDAKGKCSLDADTLRTVLVSYTKPFLFSVFVEYESIAGKSFDYAIKATSSGDARTALLAMYRGIVSRPCFFAEELHSAFQGIGFKESKLTRIVVTRSEIDLQDVKDEFELRYEKQLFKVAEKETSGDYEKTILALIEGTNGEEYRQAISQQTAESIL